MILVPRQVRMTGMTGNVPYYGGRFTPAQAYAAAHPPPPPPPPPRDESLGALDSLLRDGVLTQEEYDDLALWADELRQNVGVAAGTRAEIEHAAAFELGRHDDAATIVFRGDLWMNVGKQRLQMCGQVRAIAAG